MANRPGSGRNARYLIGIPTVLTGGLFAWAAEGALVATGVGCAVGFIIGVALLAFPDLDRGGPADNDDFMH